jgi:hypothetical protein
MNKFQFFSPTNLMISNQVNCLTSQKRQTISSSFFDVFSYTFFLDFLMDLEQID